MRIRGGARTDVGLVRRRNEDSFLVRERLFAVADGMGGHRGGNVASSLALDTVATTVPATGATAEDLVDAVRSANGAVLERALADPELEGMGTTLTAMLMRGDEGLVAHVGDSRAYLFRDGELRQVTEDHTLVRRMVVEGRLTPEEAEVHPARSILTRALGVEPEVDVDREAVSLRDGDRLLLCTDGLTGMVPEEGIRETLRREPDPQAAADALVAAAVAAGGEDNVTVLVLDALPDGDENENEAGLPVAAAAEVAEGPRAAAPSPPREPRGQALATAAALRLRELPWRRLAAWAGAVATAAAVVVVGVRLYVDRQWYVGAAAGHVAVYQGIPADVAGIRLSHVTAVTRVRAAQAERLQPWHQLFQGITAPSERAALGIVQQIRADVATAARLGRAAGPAAASGVPGAGPAPTPSPTASPSR